MQRQESRRVPRHSIAVDVEVTDVHSQIQIRERTRDLSLFGCGLEAAQLLPTGTKVKIKLSHAGEDVAATGRVVYSGPDLGMGIVFTDVEPDAERTLDDWIAVLTRLSLRGL